jgi:hypothetical protein
MSDEQLDHIYFHYGKMPYWHFMALYHTLEKLSLPPATAHPPP